MLHILLNNAKRNTICNIPITGISITNNFNDHYVLFTEKLKFYFCAVNSISSSENK